MITYDAKTKTLTTDKSNVLVWALMDGAEGDAALAKRLEEAGADFAQTLLDQGLSDHWFFEVALEFVWLSDIQEAVCAYSESANLALLEEHFKSWARAAWRKFTEVLVSEADVRSETAFLPFGRYHS